jgi:hypothetical protein
MKNTTIYQHPDGYYVFEIDYDGIQRLYQDVDFIKGGRIHTQERAQELLYKQLAMESAVDDVKNPQMEIIELKNQLKQVQEEKANLENVINLMQAALNELILGGL